MVGQPALRELDNLIEHCRGRRRAVEQGTREVNGINEHLVREELGLDWPWVMGALLRTTIRMLKEGIADPGAALPEVGDYTICSPTFKIEVGQGIPIDEVIEELRDLVATLEKMRADTGASDAARRHAVRSSDDTAIRAWGRWYYERVVKGTSERAVARASRPGGAPARAAHQSGADRPGRGLLSVDRESGVMGPARGPSGRGARPGAPGGPDPDRRAGGGERGVMTKNEPWLRRQLEWLRKTRKT